MSSLLSSLFFSCIICFYLQCQLSIDVAIGDEYLNRYSAMEGELVKMAPQMGYEAQKVTGKGKEGMLEKSSLTFRDRTR